MRIHIGNVSTFLFGSNLRSNVDQQRYSTRTLTVSLLLRVLYYCCRTSTGLRSYPGRTWPYYGTVRYTHNTYTATRACRVQTDRWLEAVHPHFQAAALQHTRFFARVASSPPRETSRNLRPCAYRSAVSSTCSFYSKAERARPPPACYS